MLQLSNTELRVELLHPVADRARLGPRYCWGGYIWQVHDREVGPVLAGPEWPNPAPSAFNGQGLPESFRHRTRDGRALTWNGERGVAIGGGELAADRDGTVSVVAPCEWTIDQTVDQATFRTRQSVDHFDYQLERRVALSGRSLVSESTLTNLGSTPLALEWFAHPFFALSDGMITAKLPVGTKISENPGFRIDGAVFTQKRRFTSHQDGHMDFLQLARNVDPTFQLSHPSLTHVTFKARLTLSECIVWGNNVTFSIEPYQTLLLPPGTSKQWSVEYDFG